MDGLFGQPLVRVHDQSYVPVAIRRILEWLSSGPHSGEVGIFWKKHDPDAAEDLERKLETNQETALAAENPRVVAAMLKTWLRDLPEPLMTNELFSDIIDAANYKTGICQSKLTACVARLPLPNYQVLSTLVRFLVDFSARQRKTKKRQGGLPRIAEVFTPLILYSETEDATHANEDGPIRAKLFQMLMEEHEMFFAERMTHPDRINGGVWSNESAVEYLNLVKNAFGDDHTAVKTFVQVMGDFQHDRLDAMEAIASLLNLFVGHASLGHQIINLFMPESAKRKAGFDVGEVSTDDEHEESFCTIRSAGTRFPESVSDGDSLDQIDTQYEEILHGSGMLQEFQRRVLEDFGEFVLVTCSTAVNHLLLTAGAESRCRLCSCCVHTGAYAREPGEEAPEK
jgi:hypothetical protein